MILRKETEKRKVNPSLKTREMGPDIHEALLRLTYLADPSFTKLGIVAISSTVRGRYYLHYKDLGASENLESRPAM